MDNCQLKEEKLQVIKFTHDYPKLDDEKFTTIRRYGGRYKVGEVYEVKAPSQRFIAFLVSKEKKTLEEMSTAFLCYDTNTANREEAIKVLNSFYKKPISETEKLSVLTFVWETLL